jgi:hypothetical protein
MPYCSAAMNDVMMYLGIFVWCKGIIALHRDLVLVVGRNPLLSSPLHCYQHDPRA